MGNKSRLNYNISDERRDEYRRSSTESRLAKQSAMLAGVDAHSVRVNVPALNPMDLMPVQASTNLRALSLFSGGGGLDLGFELAGFQHAASYDVIPVCGETLLHNRPRWEVHSGEDAGDVRRVDWRRFRGKIQVMHGGPPCQPFSIAGRQEGKHDERNMWGPYIDAIHAVRPDAFVAENVRGLLDKKFSGFVRQEILEPLRDYSITSFTVNAAGFGVPQQRERVFFVGFRSKAHHKHYEPPAYTHDFEHLTKKAHGQKNGIDQLRLFADNRQKCMGVRKALGLTDIGFDMLAPTIRSAFTGKRNTTSILNSTQSALTWSSLKIWASGVGKDRYSAHIFPTKNGHFRLSVQDCALLQGFPEAWVFQGAVYKVLGQIGNSVAPPVAYNVATSVRCALNN